MNEEQPSTTLPVWIVRFESGDDFLVAYTDHIRHGLAVVEPGPVLEPGTRGQVRFELPQGRMVDVEGVVATAAEVGRDVTLVAGQVAVRLEPLTSDHDAVFESCIADASNQGDIDDLDLGAMRSGVLLVDDWASVRIKIGDALRSHGLRVRIAENGLDGFSSALKRPPAVILTDVEMPVMDGWKLLQMVRTRRKLAHIPVLFFTRLGDEMLRLKGYRMGVDDYLPKDTPPTEIVARLQAAVARRGTQGNRESETQHGLRGHLQHVSVSSVFTFLEMERRTGRLTVTQGSKEVVLRIREGALSGVENLPPNGDPHERVFELLDWTNGSFEFSAIDGDHSDVEDSTPLGFLLMEHARRQDEANVE